MSIMLIHPQFDPVAFSVGPLAVRWYGLMYVIAFILFISLGTWRARNGPTPGWKHKDLEVLLFHGMLGVVLGGRLGFVLFYQFGYYLAHSLDIFAIWQGGMSFHGGFLGVLVALWLFGRRNGRSFLHVCDFVAPLVPLGLAAGRLGNFINGELWGRVASPDTWWAMIFPLAADEDRAAALVDPTLMNLLNQYGGLPRHPSQLYQFGLEGVTLFVVLWFLSRTTQPTGLLSAAFLIGYGCFRFIAEFARQPDDFLGLLAGRLSMGQWLSLPMIALGNLMAIIAVRRARPIKPV